MNRRKLLVNSGFVGVATWGGEGRAKSATC
jgi:hypothetical protein